MAAATFSQYVRLAYFSKPAGDRQIYRAIQRLKAKSIVEMGVGMGVRSKRLIQVAQRYAGDQQVRFTGIDMFEAREAHNPGWTVKRAHSVLTSLGAKVQVVPGDPFSALARTANSLTGTDLVVIGHDQEQDSMDRAWFYMPRMLTETSLVFLAELDEKSGKTSFRELDFTAVSEFANVCATETKKAA